MTFRTDLRAAVFLMVGLAFIVLAEPVAASNVVTGLAEDSGSAAVPNWLYVLTGGAVIGASGLLTMFVTDQEVLESIYGRTKTIRISNAIRRFIALITGTLGLAILLLIIYAGFVGPEFANASFAILMTFVGGRAGLTMVSYMIGNPWPLLNPWRLLTKRLPGRNIAYPVQFGVLPAIIGLVALIWLEVIFPVTTVPMMLAFLVCGYSLYTLAGATVFAPDQWFRYADPLSVWFRYYGAVAPIQISNDRITFRLPGSRLCEPTVVRDISGVAFIILLVWELTFSSFIVTPLGVWTVEMLVETGVSPIGAYLALLLVGYALFLGVYWFAANKSRRQAQTYLTAEYLAFRFALPLLGIAAGYHLAHYFAFFITLSPSLLAVATTPFSPPLPPQVLVLPDWIGVLDMIFVLCGHLVAIWTAHAVALDLFSSRLQAIRSQFPFIIVMVFYTMLSLWLLSLPTQQLPYI